MSSVRALALGALMIVGVAGVSAAQSSAAPQQRSGGEMRGRRGGGRGEFGRDLNLTDAQKSQMKAIHQKYQPQNEALRAQAKPYMDAARAARQKGDTAAVRTNRLKVQQIMQGGQSTRTQEMAKIRAILTSDQQAKFDAHAKATGERHEKGGHKGWGKKGAAPQKKS